LQCNATRTGRFSSCGSGTAATASALAASAGSAMAAAAPTEAAAESTTRCCRRRDGAVRAVASASWTPGPTRRGVCSRGRLAARDSRRASKRSDDVMARDMARTLGGGGSSSSGGAVAALLAQSPAERCVAPHSGLATRRYKGQALDLTAGARGSRPVGVQAARGRRGVEGRPRRRAPVAAAGQMAAVRAGRLPRGRPRVPALGVRGAQRPHHCDRGRRRRHHWYSAARAVAKGGHATTLTGLIGRACVPANS